MGRSGRVALSACVKNHHLTRISILLGEGKKQTFSELFPRTALSSEPDIHPLIKSAPQPRELGVFLPEEGETQTHFSCELGQARLCRGNKQPQESQGFYAVTVYLPLSSSPPSSDSVILAALTFRHTASAQVFGTVRHRRASPKWPR